MKIRIKRERLARELARKSLSLNGWGQRLGLSKGHLSLLLNDRRRYPNPETRRKLLEGLSLRFEDLFEFEDRGDPAPGAMPRPFESPTPPARKFPLPRKGDPGLNVLTMELRYALRTLLRRPGLTLASVLTLALGIGAVTAIFGVVEAVLLRPLPFQAPHRLALLGAIRQSGGSQGYVSRPEFLDLAELKGIFQGVAATEPWVTDWTGLSEPRQLSAGSVSAGFFQLLGVDLLLGRGFRPPENRPGADPVVILSHQLFQNHFGGSEDALQQFLQLDGLPHRIVGVMPAGFGLLHPGISTLESKDVWIPLRLDPGRMRRRSSSFTRVIARLQEGVSWERARAEVGALSSRLVRQHPSDYPTDGFRLQVVPLEERILGGTRSILMAFLGAVGLLLLLVCFNLATLQLARAETRQGELTVRLALGANRWRLLRQSLTEGTLLALAGAGLGLLSAAWGLDLLRSLQADILPRLDEARIDGAVLAAALGASLASLLLFSLAPAWLSTGMLNQTRIGSRSAPLPGVTRGSDRHWWLPKLRWLWCF
ncbi:MAG: ABC transporter permease [Acidobacteriota bacterium]